VKRSSASQKSSGLPDHPSEEEKKKKKEEK